MARKKKTVFPTKSILNKFFDLSLFLTKQMDQEVKGRILALRELKWTHKQIAEQVNIPVSTVGDFLRNYAKTPTTQRRPGSGRPKKLDDEQRDLIRGWVVKNPRCTAEFLADKAWKTLKIKVSKRTIENNLINRV